MNNFSKISDVKTQFLIIHYELLIVTLAGSSNGRTTPFGGVCRGSNPLPAALFAG